MTEAAVSQVDMTVAQRKSHGTRSERQDCSKNSIWEKLVDRLWNHAEETSEMDAQSFKGLL